MVATTWPSMAILEAIHGAANDVPLQLHHPWPCGFVRPTSGHVVGTHAHHIGAARHDADPIMLSTPGITMYASHWDRR